MKCNERCLELRLGDTCGRCGGIVDVKKPPARPWNAPLSRAELLEAMAIAYKASSPFRGGQWNNEPIGEVTEHRSEDGSIVFRRLNRPVPVDGLSPSQRLMLGPGAGAERYLRHFARQYGPLDEAHRAKVRRYFESAEVEDDSMRRMPRYFVRADGELEPDVKADLDAELVLANFQLAHDVVASMSEGPRPRAADDADGIQKAMREIHLAEGRRPLSCAPGQHNFQWSSGVYTCTVCLRGKPEDGR